MLYAIRIPFDVTLLPLLLYQHCRIQSCTSNLTMNLTFWSSSPPPPTLLCIIPFIPKWGILHWRWRQQKGYLGCFCIYSWCLLLFFISMDTYTQYRSLPIYHQTTRATTRYVKAAKKAYDLNLNKSHWIERGD